jgi:hypothetical protein
MNVQVSAHEKARRWPCAIDMHAHLMIPEMYRITGPHSMFVKSNTDHITPPEMGREPNAAASLRVTISSYKSVGI